jgi:hypothetical protein
MGFTFSLVLSREISEEESAVLREAGCASAVFTTDALPTNAEVPVTKMEFDDTMSPSLAEAIESALEAVKVVPDLSVPGLIVPAQPAERQSEDTPAGTVAGEVVAVEEVTEAAEVTEVTEEKPARKKPTARKASGKKGAATSNGHAEKAEIAVEAG